MCGSILLRYHRSLSVLVGSANPVKINSVKQALLAACPEIQADVKGTLRSRPSLFL